jgi:hypothetical protein
MSNTLFGARGCVYRTGKPGAGAYKLAGLPRGTKDSPILLQGASINDSDAVAPMLSVGRSKIIYVFGSNFGSVEVSGLCLLGSVEGGQGSLGQVIGFFNSKRINRSSGPTQLSVPGGSAFNVYITGLVIGEADPVFNIQPFAVVGMLAEET